MKKKKSKKQGVKNKKTILTEQQYLTREIIMAIKNIKPSYWNWKNIIMKVKMLEMKHNVEVIKNTFDHALDMKQYRENLLLSCLNECKKQYQGNVNEHLRIIGLLESIYEYKLNTALNNYGLIFNLLIDGFGVSFEKLCSLQRDDEIFIRSILFEKQNKMETTLHDTKSEIFYKLENIKRNGDDISKIALVHLEKKVSSAWNFLTKILSKYSKDNQYRQLSYENLNKKDTKSKEIIVQQFIQITELIDFIASFRSKLIKFHSHEKISKIIFDKNLLVNNYALMEKRFIKERKMDKLQLNLLVKQYDCTMKKLKKLTEKSHDMLFLIRACRKFQVHSEKLLPVQCNQLNKQSDYFEFFWYKVNTAIVLMNNLKQEKKILLQEWEHLCKCLKCRITN